MAKSQTLRFFSNPIFFWDHFGSNHGGNIMVLMYLFNQRDISVKSTMDMVILYFIWLVKILTTSPLMYVNVQDKCNNNPVHFGFGAFNPDDSGDITVLTYLLNQNNVNVNIKNEKGCNLLHTTCINNLPSYKRSVELDAEYDTVFCQIIEYIIERCVQQVLDETAL
jgi:hypothetical protein